jgi:hypothetical protein
MAELASLFAAYAAFALIHMADAQRVPRGIHAVLRRVRFARPALRGLALVAFALSSWCWSRVEDGLGIFLVPFTAFMAAASLFVLLAPYMPRLVWGLALLFPPLVFAFLVSEVGHGFF